MTNFYGELTKIILIVLTTPSKLLLIKQNATWKAGARNGQKRPKAKTKKTTKKIKITRKMRLLFLQRITTPTPPEPAKKQQKCTPRSRTSFFLI